MNHRVGLLVAVLLVAALFNGCGDSQETAAEQTEAVEVSTTEAAPEVAAALTAAEEELIAKVAAIAAAVDKAPATTEAVLEQYGMTAEEYEAAVYEIASNPTLSEAFEKARAQ